MKKTSIILLAFAIPVSTSAQTDLDSLWATWENETISDSLRIAAMHDFIWEGYLFSDPDSAFYFAEMQQDFSKMTSQHWGVSDALLNKGITHVIKSEFDPAMYHFEQGLKLSVDHNATIQQVEALTNIGIVHSMQRQLRSALHTYSRAVVLADSIGYWQGQAKNLENIATIYFDQGDYPKALEYFQEAITLFEDQTDRPQSGNTFGNIGNIYFEQGNNTQALEYFQRSLKASKSSGDKFGEATSLHSIANVHLDEGDHSQALEYYQRSQVIREELGDQRGLAHLLHNIGVLNEKQRNYIKALEYCNRSLLIGEELGDKGIMATSLISIGLIYQSQEDYPRALESCKKGLELAKEVGVLQPQKKSCDCLYQTYKAMGNSRSALEYLEQFEIIEDSLNETETAKKLQRFEFDKELLADSLRQEEEKHTIELAHQEEVAQKDKTRNMLMGGGLLLLLVAGGLFSRNRYVNRSKKQIQKEKDRSEELLLNILPEEVAEELKDKGEAEAQLIDQVTVLFTDFKGFTALSEQLSPKELVDDLNTCFSEFDKITSKFCVEKIKTIGDAYMAAGGLPTPNTTHATDVIKAAMEMRDFVEAGKARKIEAGLPYFEIRIGVHTGPVVAGIVGVKKFQYDIWGDTVNTASRMESSGEVGQVNISEATYELVKENSEFDFTSRGKVEAKGKGEMEMFFVEPVPQDRG